MPVISFFIMSFLLTTVLAVCSFFLKFPFLDLKLIWCRHYPSAYFQQCWCATLPTLRCFSHFFLLLNSFSLEDPFFLQAVEHNQDGNAQQTLLATPDLQVLLSSVYNIFAITVFPFSSLGLLGRLHKTICCSRFAGLLTCHICYLFEPHNCSLAGPACPLEAVLRQPRESAFDDGT